MSTFKPSSVRSSVLPTLLVTGALALAGCASSGGSAAASGGSASRSGGGWISLMDLSQWRGYRRDTAPASWKLQDGALTLDASVTDRAQRGDLMTREQFGDFELEYEWKISPGGNSGVIYRIAEQEDTPWKTGPEMQVLDNERHADGKLPSHRAGALYDLIVPPDNITRPVGEWNQARIRVQGNHIQQWLNGKLTADVVVGSPQWEEMYGKSKFKPYASFARVPRGYIALQDHGDAVWYRNIRVRPL